MYVSERSTRGLEPDTLPVRGQGLLVPQEGREGQERVPKRCSGANLCRVPPCVGRPLEPMTSTEGHKRALGAPEPTRLPPPP